MYIIHVCTGMNEKNCPKSMLKWPLSKLLFKNFLYCGRGTSPSPTPSPRLVATVTCITNWYWSGPPPLSQNPGPSLIENLYLPLG